MNIHTPMQNLYFLLKCIPKLDNESVKRQPQNYSEQLVHKASVLVMWMLLAFNIDIQQFNTAVGSEDTINPIDLQKPPLKLCSYA